MANKTNIQKALSILKGQTVVAHDRRKGDAHAIPFKEFRTKTTRVFNPLYGISHSMFTELKRLADKVTFVDGMPRFHYNV